MAVDTVTSITLLEGLKDPRNEAAWRRFMDRYRPILIGFARRLGLSPSDAEDATLSARVFSFDSRDTSRMIVTNMTSLTQRHHPHRHGENVSAEVSS